MMRLSDLNPRWVGAGGAGIFRRADDGTLEPVPERHGVGISFDCPCGQCGQRTYVDFQNPLDGGPPHQNDSRARWERNGDTFDTLTLRPSLLRSREKGGCGWHGFITNGAVETA